MPRSPETTNCDAVVGDSSDAFNQRIQAVFAPVGSTDGGNQPGAINAAPPLPDNYSGNVQQHLDNQPLAVSDAGFETGWASWLLCDDFNLDAVNSSLLQATAEESVQIPVWKMVGSTNVIVKSSLSVSSRESRQEFFLRPPS
ncbi:uncharacterized protein LDX57_010652 [Aspergillus melleus]|uniref:uncharacterized protein n=1 Tax=Aspergillus melleus TaxID=138277 RepID=UPI001E8E7AB1|nr:uncharacterized protein LDX57_010652 [Aspergillus melleus]KAH8433015.1 hypothetical protein LDX57_010652 [Aspergillus melleus]